MDVDSVIQAFKASPQASAFVLDFDGTLSLIVEEPSLAKPIPQATETLTALGDAYGMVALVSGRTAKDLHRMLGAIQTVRYLGVYGAEEMIKDQVAQPAEADHWRGMASRLARDAQALIVSEGLAGCHVEYKDIAVSIHYRQAASGDAPEAIMAWASQAAAKKGFTAGFGRKVVEMRPSAVSKARALERLLTALPISNLLIAGDDAADAEAMSHARSLGLEICFTVGVGSREAPEELEGAADVLVDSPSELLTMLQRFL
ncbi:MAG TPA: trehalose-phosphatase [Actinomycetota bacterium]|nr:trehalose-phosphatase [Actinomycetota bacterium]